MIPEIGQLALILALMLAIVQGVLPIVGAARGVQAWMGVARPAALGQFVFVAIAFVCLGWSFASNDFSVLNVATNSNSQLPLQYRIAATWGSHEGSILLWVLMLGIWTAAVTVFSRHLPEEVVARVLGVMGLISSGFLLFMLLTSNPFARLLPAAEDGRDLNPLLQDPGMVIHPPMLYMGYVGFSVAFAFAIAALLGGRLDATWARWSRPWTILAWCFLTCGIALGSGWAYYELGWGGWWFWDPVENASFMPWLVGTALLHSLAVTEKRGGFRSWTVLLAICAFSLSLLGTFLVRSGVLTSVHAFATDPRRGVFILAFLVTVIGGSLALFAWRAPRVGHGGSFEPVSRESMLLTNNVFLVVAAGSVLLGTLYPLFLDALNLGKISVGPPYFEAVFVPLMTPALFLMGVGPLARWKEASLAEIAARLRWALAVSVVSALLVPLATANWSIAQWRPLVSFGLALAFWILAASAVNLRERLARMPGGLGVRIASQPTGYYGMLLAHCGVAVFIIGVTLVRGYEVERDVRMEIGDTVMVGGYSFRFDGAKDVKGPNYRAARGTVSVSRDGKEVTVLKPEKRAYNVSNMPMTEAAIDTGPFTDLYVSLGEPVDNGAWSVRIYFKPFISWIWGGCAIMALGGLLALADRRYRRTARREARLSPASAQLSGASWWRSTGARDMNRFLFPLGVFVVLVGFLAVGLTLNPREVPSPLVDKPVPAFKLAQLQQPELDFSQKDMLGQVWLLNVWASWCVSCRDEHPILVDLARERIVPVVGLNYKDKPVEAKAWLKQFGDPYMLSVTDKDGRVGIDYGVYGVPETFVIDRAGVIRYKQIGPVTREALESKILPLVRQLQKS